MEVVEKPGFSSGTPGTTGGRLYPDHLKRFEAFDSVFLVALAKEGEASTTQLARRIADGPDGQNLARNTRLWLASADWRKLVERLGDEESRSYAISSLGRQKLDPSS